MVLLNSAFNTKRVVRESYRVAPKRILTHGVVSAATLVPVPLVFCSAAAPMATLAPSRPSLPTAVLEESASDPIATLPFPVVLLKSASKPTAVLLLALF